MSKRRINQQQSIRIKQQQEKKQLLADAQHGLVIAHYGRYTDVKISEMIYHCKLRQNLGDIVVGDKVLCEVKNAETAVIQAIESRKSIFYRQDDRQQKKLIAANIDQVFVVMAPMPEPSWLLLDSYLAAIQQLKLPALIVVNKIDLAIDQYAEYWQIYQELAIPIIFVSALNGIGMEQLKTAMTDQSNVLVGQSGVGKTSLIKALVPSEELSIGELHHTTGLGTHTTSTARLYELTFGGSLIDSPGIRDFQLDPTSSEQLAASFSEFLPYIKQCKFRNCSHQHEPNCALQTAVAAGKIAISRFNNYHVLLQRFKDNSV